MAIAWITELRHLGLALQQSSLDVPQSRLKSYRAANAIFENIGPRGCLTLTTSKEQMSTSVTFWTEGCRLINLSHRCMPYCYKPFYETNEDN